MQTTNPEDLEDKEEEEELNNLLESQSLLNELNHDIEEEGKLSKIKSLASLSMQIRRYKKSKKKKLPWNVTKQYPIRDYFIVIPFSPLFYIWSWLILFICTYILFIVPFAISYQYEFEVWLIPIDILLIQIIWVIDIFFTLKTSFNKKFEITLDLKEVAIDYMDSRFFIDILAVLPIDYLLMLFGAGQQTVAWIRILRLLKLYKFFDYIKIWRKHSNVKIALFTLFLLSLLFVIISHLMGCIYFYIGRHEVGKGRRYDGQTLFENTLDRDFLELKPILEISIVEQYVHFFYLSAWTMGAVMYGDLIPLTLSEQIFTFGAMFTARIYLAFLYAEAAAYLSEVNSAYSNRLKLKSTIGKNPKLKNLSFDMKKRMYNYHEILGKNFKGVTESQVLDDLPVSIGKEIKFTLFSDLINNIHIFPKDDEAAISALIWRLELHMCLKDEYVIWEGEIADCMYFILRGKVNVIKGGVILATLDQGAHFGEMALAENKPTTRTASIMWTTPCSVGSLSITNFNILTQFYPIFKSKIEEEVIKRKKDLMDKTKKVTKKLFKLINKDLESNKDQEDKSKSSKKESRQSAYEIADEEDVTIKIKERKSGLGALSGDKSKKSSLKSEEKSHLEQIKHQANQILDDQMEIEGQNPDQMNDSHAPLVIQENPNMPDGVVISNPAIQNNEEEESKEAVHESDSEREMTRKKASKPKGLEEGEAEVKAAKPKCR